VQIGLLPEGVGEVVRIGEADALLLQAIAGMPFCAEQREAEQEGHRERQQEGPFFHWRCWNRRQRAWGKVPIAVAWSSRRHMLLGWIAGVFCRQWVRRA
jgi:hypothetical protein